MKHRFLTEAGLALLAIGALASLSGSPEGDEPQEHGQNAPAATEHGGEAEAHGGHGAPAVELPPHARAPHDIALEVLDKDKVRAPGEDWFAAQAELDPERFQYVEGDGYWWDAEGEYVWEKDEFEDEYAYWQGLSADRLTNGRKDYVQFCASCHGFEGDGYGRSAMGLRPPPRDFRQSNFKFAKHIGNLPTDDALLHLVKRGLDGTPMYPWALSDEQILDIIQYIKTLSPKGGLDEDGEPQTGRGWRNVYTTIGGKVDVGEDPWTDNVAQARTQGERLYHGKAGCHACHPGYVTPERLAEIRGDAAGTRYRDDLSYPALKESEYDVLGHQQQILPPDFTWHTVRAGDTAKELCETIAAGIKGTAMPQWKGAVSDKDLWAMAHYVRGLIEDYKNEPEARQAFMAGLRGQ